MAGTLMGSRRTVAVVVALARSGPASLPAAQVRLNAITASTSHTSRGHDCQAASLFCCPKAVVSWGTSVPQAAVEHPEVAVGEVPAGGGVAILADAFGQELVLTLARRDESEHAAVGTS
jgi:hypothetical protein